MNRKAIAIPTMMLIVGSLMASTIIGVETQNLLGLEDSAIEETLSLQTLRIENVLIAIDQTEDIEVEIDMTREFEIEVIDGATYIYYGEEESEIDAGNDPTVDEGEFETLCIVQKPGENIALRRGEC